MFATGRMIITANSWSTTESAELINQGCDLLDDLSESAASSPGLAESLICRQERASAFDRLGEHDKALDQLNGAVQVAR